MKRIKSVVSSSVKSTSIFVGSFLGMFFGMPNVVLAKSDWLPAWIETITGELTGPGGPVGWAKTKVSWGLTLLFIAVFLVAIIYSALAGIKFISSQGDASKLEESKGAVKAILMGFAAMIIAIVGIFIIMWFFNAQTEFNSALNVVNKPK